MENNIVGLVGSLAVVATFLGGICLGLTELAKNFLVNNTKYAPLFSILFGIILAYFFIGFEIPVAVRILMGVIIGLTASGFYSGVKRLTE